MSVSLSLLTAIFGKHILGIGLGWGLVAMWAVFALDETSAASFPSVGTDVPRKH